MKFKLPILNKEENVYVEKFWEWWPELYKSLRVFRITGGEPLLNKNTFKILDYIIDNPNPELSIAVNTNLNPPSDIFEKFTAKLNLITEKKLVKNLGIYTSAEGHSRCAEYSRFGMNYNKWLENLNYILGHINGVHCTIMSTYNIFSLTSYNQFMADMIAARANILKSNTNSTLLVDIPYLNHPKHLSVLTLDDKEKYFIQNTLDYMKQNGCVPSEIEKMNRIVQLTKVARANPVDQYDFVKFVDEYDRRRNTNFLETFSELSDMYYRWKKL